MRAFSIVGFVTALLMLTGCGGGPQFASVSGRVTLNDQPLANVQVDFQPIASGRDQAPGPGSTAITDAEGRFVLHCQLDTSQAGAIVGKHQVRIWMGERNDADADADSANPRKKATRPIVPGRYNVESTLTFDVPAGGTDKADFKLTAP